MSLEAIQFFHNPSTDAFFILLSFLGSEPTYILIIVVLFWNVDKRFGFRLAVLFLTSMAFNGFLKDLFHTQRPIGQAGVRSLYLSSAAGNSFPSGHSQGAATFYPYVWQHWRRQKIWHRIGIFMILGIGFSRLYLGVHWPGDILGGYFFGALMVLGFQRLDETLFKLSISLSSKLLLSGTLPLLFLLVYHTSAGWQMAGFVLGFTSGYFLEDTFLDYREHTQFTSSLFKTLVGLTLLGLWLWLWNPLTQHYTWVYLPVLTIGGLWTSFGAPYMFRRIGWEGPLLEERPKAARITDRTDQA
ncbi:MAG: phosphatase PAP2 family protein [Desulfosporosinus sp.]